MNIINILVAIGGIAALIAVIKSFVDFTKQVNNELSKSKLQRKQSEANFSSFLDQADQIKKTITHAS